MFSTVLVLANHISITILCRDDHAIIHNVIAHINNSCQKSAWIIAQINNRCFCTICLHLIDSIFKFLCCIVVELCNCNITNLIIQHLAFYRVILHSTTLYIKLQIIGFGLTVNLQMCLRSFFATDHIYYHRKLLIGNLRVIYLN